VYLLTKKKEREDYKKEITEESSVTGEEEKNGIQRLHKSGGENFYFWHHLVGG
jgi:hypothetical protein